MILICVKENLQIYSYVRNFQLSNSHDQLKGLEPKLHDLALSMGENKTLNFKDVTLLKPLQDTMLSISISSFV
jgi:hypothetical protein